jgi:HD-GYP domain-containing protein (c-di-GMP phosphodiesterase class II)
MTALPRLALPHSGAAKPERDLAMLTTQPDFGYFQLHARAGAQRSSSWIPAGTDGEKQGTVVKFNPLGRSNETIDPASAERRVVYCQSGQAARLLNGEDVPWRVAPLSENFSTNNGDPAIVICDAAEMLSPDLRQAVESDQARLICVSESRQQLTSATNSLPIFKLLIGPLAIETLRSAIVEAFGDLALRSRHGKLEQDLRRAQNEISRLNEIGIALSTQRDGESLLRLILQKSCEITDSDAGSLYLVEELGDGVKRLRFKITQNNSMSLSFHETVLPLDNASIAGYIALTGEEVHLADVYQIPQAFPFGFNRKFDEESGYRCKSMLAVPMKNPRDEVIGVVQLINCKRDAAARLDRRTAEELVVSYPDECRPLLRSLASQAAVALENIRLYESVEALFEGFVSASVSAIEARDPTTYGHSFRVADMTVALAEIVDRDESRYFGNVHFGRAEMKEIRYASLLHDFGKVGVREEILVKAKKLYPLQLDVVRERFAYARKALEHSHSERKLAYLLEKGREEFVRHEARLQTELEEQLREIDEFFKFILRCNEPTVLQDGNFARLSEFAAREFIDIAGERRPLLSDYELTLLSISQGNLDERERRQIQSHVSHTLNFLRQIPWTKDIKNIPAIASAHHEKLDGSGYPNSLSATEIPIQSKMMTIADIYDALSATDRPYKNAVPTERALDILFDEAKRGLIDGELLSLFRNAEIFKLTSNWKAN